MPVIRLRDVILGKGRPAICVPLSERTEDGLRFSLQRMKDHRFDIIEWRADSFEALYDPAGVEKAAGIIRDAFPEKPLIFTIRTNLDMGDYEISDERYKNLNYYAIEHRLADLIDIEFRRGKGIVRDMTDIAHANGLVLICSWHERDSTPPAETILDTLLEMETAGADIVKYAAMPRSAEDVLALMEATLRFSTRDGAAPVVTMSMGRAGMISRISGGLTGSCMTFASAGVSTAPGQMPCGILGGILDVLEDKT